jgi:DNA-binding transcriptional MerR regulator
LTEDAGRLWPEEGPGASEGGDGRLSIGTVRDILQAEFPSVSISKIRYLEDQKLITPQRTPSGYRLYTQSEVERLRTVLRLQRDEFLPLRVIRQELESASPGSGGTFSAVNQARQLKRAQLGEPTPSRRHSASEVSKATGATPAMLAELESYGLVTPDASGYDETDREIVTTAMELAEFGVEPRHLRLFRVSSDREAGLLEQAALASQLRHLTLISVLRRLVASGTAAR